MKKLMIMIAIVIGSSTPVLGLEYDHKNIVHKGDKECIAILSIMRDATFENGMTEDYQLLTDLQNKLILKYDYSSKLNAHVDAFKMYAITMVNQGTDLTEMSLACIQRAVQQYPS